ncbi:MAG: Ger(x)C family spore germination protein [Bacillota bacterium]
MKFKWIILMLLILSTIIISGCWDSIELNEQATVLGTGIDLTEDKEYLYSAQIVIPSALGGSQQGGGGGGGKQFFVVTVTAPTFEEAIRKMQTKVSRRLNWGHRQSVYIGERLAKHGIRDIFDVFTRDPNSRIIGEVSVIKGYQALEALKMSVPLEYTPTIATLKKHEEKYTSVKNILLDFFVVSASETKSPTLPTLTIKEGEEDLLTIGSAIFDKETKVIGFLNEEETNDKLWILKDLTNQEIIVPIPEEKGTINLRLNKLKSKVKPMLVQDHVKFQITLSGNGRVIESSASLDLTKAETLEKVEQAAEDYTEKRVSQLIKKVQSEYGADIFGLGETFFRKNPSQWKKIKNDWETEFQQADVSVKVDLTIQQIGLTGSSQLQQDNDY